MFSEYTLFIGVYTHNVFGDSGCFRMLILLLCGYDHAQYNTIRK